VPILLKNPKEIRAIRPLQTGSREEVSMQFLIRTSLVVVAAAIYNPHVAPPVKNRQLTTFRP
jgi:hypothetical protein